MPRKPKSKARRTLIYGADGIDKSGWATRQKVLRVLDATAVIDSRETFPWNADRGTVPTDNVAKAIALDAE